MRILFVVLGDETRASTRYRVFNLLPALDDADIEYDYLSVAELAASVPGPDLLGYLLTPLLMLTRARQYDAVFLQKVPLPSPFLWVLKTQCDTLIYDFDDAIYATPPWRDSTSSWEFLLKQTLSNCTLAITGSPVLSEYAEQFCDQTVCLPTALPAEKYKSARKQRQERKQSDGVTISWIGNPQNLHYLNSIAAPLETVLDSFAEVRLTVITAGDLPVTPLKRRSDVEYEEWSLNSELELLGEADIGIRPLFDDEWTRGKGGYTSVVQMMALEIPVVVTPVSMLSDIVEHGISGFHAESDEEWVRYLSELIEDTERRTQMGTEAYQRVDRLDFWAEERGADLSERLDNV